MSDIPSAAGGEDPLEPVEPVEPELDEDGNPVESVESEFDQDGDVEPELDEEVEPAPRRGGGGAATPRNLRRRAQEAERERDDARRQLQDVSARQANLEARLANDPGAQARSAAEEAERLAIMTPAEVGRYFYQKGLNETRQALFQQQFQTHEAFDKRKYDEAARTSKLHQRYHKEVDDVLRAERAQNRNPDREDILNHLIGRDVRDRAGRAAPVQRRQAQARVAGQQARPGGARGDAPAGRRPAAGTYEADLALIEGKPIW